MLNIRLEIAGIDYQKSVEALLPGLAERCAAAEQPGELERFVGKLGPDAVPLACGLLDYLDVDTKDRLVVWLITTHDTELRAAANRYLAELLPGPAVEVGLLSAFDRPGAALALYAARVRVDYAALLSSPLAREGLSQLGPGHPLLKGAARLAIQAGKQMDPSRLEKQGVALLGTDAVKNKLCGALSDALGRAGLFVQLGDMAVETSDVIRLPDRLPQPPARDNGLIPDELADALTDALAAWLRDRI